MTEELLKYLLVTLLVLFAFIPVTLNALKRRRENPPPMAAHDRSCIDYGVRIRKRIKGNMVN